MSETRPRRRLRLALVVLAVLLFVPVAAGAALFATFDADHYKPQILAALRRATGRDVSVNGDIRLSLDPGLTLEAEDAALGNVPNGTRPDMATLPRIEAKVAFWPLLTGHVQIRRLLLVRPDILLETDAEGHPNWRFRRGGNGGSVPTLASAIAKRAHGSHLDIHSIHITDGTLTFRDGRTGETRVFGMPEFDLAESSPDAPVSFSGTVAYGGERVAVSGRLGALARLRQPAAAGPWPVQVSLSGKGLQLNLVGSFTDPRHARGYTLRIEGKAADLDRLAALLPDPKLVPPLRDVAFSVQANDAGGNWPEPSSVVIHAGRSDFRDRIPGLELASLDLSAPGLDRPMQLAFQGSYFGAPVKVAANLGAPSTMLHGGILGLPYPLDITAEAAGANLLVKAEAAPGAANARKIEVSAKIPDLAALSPLVHRRLPKLHNVAFEGDIVPRGGSFFDGAVVKGMKLTMPQADVTGGAVLVLGGTRPMLHASLSSIRIDADAIVAAAAAPSPAATVAPAGPAPVQPIAAKQSETASAAPAGRPMLLRNQKLPVEKFRRADAEMKITVGQLLLGGIEYRNVIARYRLTNGHLHVAPLEGIAPSGPFDIYFDFNPNQPQIPVVFSAHSRGLPLKPILAALRLPDDASGELEIDADLKSTGDTPRAIAEGLTGHLGLALVNGTIDNRMLAAPLNGLLHNAKLPRVIGAKSGHSDVRCFAMRADANRGEVSLRTLVLDMNHFHLSASGNVDLDNETLALRSRPMLKFAGGGVVVPVRIDGPLSAPRAQSDSDAAAMAATLAQKLVTQPKAEAAATDATNCDVALALARGAPVIAAPQPAPKPTQARPKHERKLSRHKLPRRVSR